MPSIFIYALIGFAVVVVLIMLFLIVVKGLRPSHDSTIGPSSPNDSNSMMS
jgi:hypothetical protein